MKTKHSLLLALAGMVLSLPSQAQPVCLDFGPPPPFNTTYGTPVGQSSGDLAFSTSGIDAYVYNFALIPAGTAFNRAIHRIAPVSLPGQSLWMASINMHQHAARFPQHRLHGQESEAQLPGPRRLRKPCGQRERNPSRPDRGGPGGPRICGGQEFWIDNVCAGDPRIRWRP